MPLSPGWMRAAFPAGILFAGRSRRHKPSLQTRVKKAAVFRGKLYREILGEIGEARRAIQRTYVRPLRE